MEQYADVFSFCPGYPCYKSCTLKPKSKKEHDSVTLPSAISDSATVCKRAKFPMIAKTEVETHRFSINGHFYNHEVQMFMLVSHHLRLATGAYKNVQQASGLPLHPVSQEGHSPLPPITGPWAQPLGSIFRVFSRGGLSLHGHCMGRRVCGILSGAASWGCYFLLLRTLPALCYIPHSLLWSCAGLDPFESHSLSKGVLILCSFAAVFIPRHQFLLQLLDQKPK